MNKQTLTMLGVAIVLVAALLVFENPFQTRAPRKRPEEQVQLYQPLTEQECTRIEVRGMGTTGTLVRKNHEWLTSNGYKADTDAVTQLFAAFEIMGQPDLVSINPNAFLNFRVDQVTGISLRMFNKQNVPQVDLIIGEMEHSLFQTPVRKPDSEKVYLVRGMLRGLVQRRDWRDHYIVKLEPGQIKQVKVQRPEESYTVERDLPAGTWHFSEPTSAPVDAPTVEGWVQQIARLQTTEFEPTSNTDTLTTYGLTTARSKITFVLDGGSSYSVVFGNLDARRQQYYAERLGVPQVYRVAEYFYTNSLRKSADLKPKTLPPPPGTSFPGAPGEVGAPGVPPTMPPPGAIRTPAAVPPPIPKVVPRTTPAAPPTPPKGAAVTPGVPKLTPKPTPTTSGKTTPSAPKKPAPSAASKSTPSGSAKSTPKKSAKPPSDVAPKSTKPTSGSLSK